MSFWTQVDEVQRHGFAMWEALIWGSSTDAGNIACMFLAREGPHRGTPTWGAWVLSITCAALSMQFNIVAGVQRGDWLSPASGSAAGPRWTALGLRTGGPRAAVRQGRATC